MQATTLPMVVQAVAWTLQVLSLPHGFEATSMRQVAAAAGVDSALVRRFFGSKEELFTEVATALIVPELALAAVAREHAAGLLRRLLADQVLGELAASFRSETPELGAALAASQLVGLAVARCAVRLLAPPPRI